MTLPASGAISISAINAEFSRGTDLNAYRGTRWYLDNAGTGLFSSTAISMSDFYSKRVNSPVTPGSTTLTSSQTFTVPLYSILTISLYGGGGGGQGGNGNTTGGGAGGNGGTSSFGSYGSGGGGQGGGQGGGNGAGFTTGCAAGGAGGAPNGPGSTGEAGGGGGLTTITLSNPIVGGNGPAVGAGVSVTVGGGGGGGSAGNGIFYVGSTPYPYNCAPGGSGGAGSVVISWA
jgi:hypothetical protein